MNFRFNFVFKISDRFQAHSSSRRISFSIRNVLESAGSDLVAALLEAEGNSNETTTRIAPRQSRKSLVCFRFSLLFIESRERATRRYALCVHFVLPHAFIISSIRCCLLNKHK